MKRISIAVLVVVLLALAAWPHTAKAGFFGPDPCMLKVPPGPFTYDSASVIFEQALRHEGNGADISTLSTEDYAHAAELVVDCAPR